MNITVVRQTITAVIIAILVPLMAHGETGYGNCTADKAPNPDCGLTRKMYNQISDDLLRITNGAISLAGRGDDVAGFRNPVALPYASDNFMMTFTVDGKQLAPEANAWKVNDYDRRALAGDVLVNSTLTLNGDSRSFMSLVQLNEMNGATRTVEVAYDFKGDFYKYGRISCDKTGLAKPVVSRYNKEIALLTVANEDGAGMYCLPAMPDIAMDGSRLTSRITLTPHGAATIYIACAVGDSEDTKPIIASFNTPMAFVRANQNWLESAYATQAMSFPHIVTSDTALKSLYDKSLLAYTLSSWQAPGAYFTGRIYGGGNGVCEGVAPSLRSISDAAIMLSMADPKSMTAHIKLFTLGANLNRTASLSPFVGRKEGFDSSWDNTYRLVRTVRDYIAVTGDWDIMVSPVSGKPLWQRLVELADDGMSGDTMPVAWTPAYMKMIFGEVRKTDYRTEAALANSRRALTYLMLSQLVKLPGVPEDMPALMKSKAKYLAGAVRASMWDGRSRWYVFSGRLSGDEIVDLAQLEVIHPFITPPARAKAMAGWISTGKLLTPTGARQYVAVDNRATVQRAAMFQRVSDVARAIDILTDAGQTVKAFALLDRIKWWGGSFAYLPEYISSERQVGGSEYEGGMPTASGLAIAQTIITGIFGVDVNVMGEISVTPRPFGKNRRITLKNLAIRGHQITITQKGSKSFIVVDGTRKFTVRAGARAVILPAAGVTLTPPPENECRKRAREAAEKEAALQAEMNKTTKKDTKKSAKPVPKRKDKK